MSLHKQICDVWALHSCALAVGLGCSKRVGVSIVDASCVTRIKFCDVTKMCDVVGIVLYEVGSTYVQMHKPLATSPHVVTNKTYKHNKQVSRSRDKYEAGWHILMQHVQRR